MSRSTEHFVGRLISEPGRAGAKFIHSLARAFLSADTSSDHRLSEREFIAAVPEQMKAHRSSEELHQLFVVVDADGDGSVSIDEYFMWTLTFLKTSCGSGLEDVFRRYSSSADGSWSVLELAAAAEDIGFGSVADELFVELDSTNSGAIQHLEVLRHIQSGGISRVGAS